MNNTATCELPSVPPVGSGRFVSHHGRTHLDLFSGIGGFALAAQAAGFKTIGFAEIDTYASAILKRHWPNITNYGDVRNVPAVQCDLITGGFPCQPFSVAGKQRGAEDDRFLWPTMLAIIEKCKPAWVLGENVAGLVNMELDRCISDLENIGYEVQPLIIPACAVDARHRRDRVWIICHAKHDGQLATEICGGSAQGNDTGASRQKQARESAGSSEQLPSLADTLCERSEAGLSEPKQWETRPTGKSINGDSGRPGGYCRWQPEPAICRVANGIPNRSHRLKGLGNAIVPQVAEEILKNLVMANILLGQTPANEK